MTATTGSAVPAGRDDTDDPADLGDVVLDAAGGDRGGAARWRGELDAYLAGSAVRPRVIGRGQRIGPGWLLRRERLVRGARLVIAPNNVSFGYAGRERRVLLRNALHFLHPDEEHLLGRLPRSFRAQIPMVRLLARRADLVVVPCGAMADRVVRHVPAVRHRIAVRPHPVTPVDAWAPDDRAWLLVPVVAAGYKNLVPQLRMLLDTVGRGGPDPAGRGGAAAEHGIEVRVTARPGDLPPDVTAHPALRAIGVVPHDQLLSFWRRATAVYYPCTLESFGYPLAEARASGIPIIAPETAQAREIAGRALLGYQPDDPESLAAAVARIREPVVADPAPFDRTGYFDWLLGPEPGRAAGRGGR
ncbi:mannosyltransferase [Plantactinospora sp. BC1]|uniref:glycosyltransferase n=1 Tax=Plantactinospora sp. BC1 TaxID=2108470 RepID=UPI000D177D12|nr:glycosyltransferase [Plantactinospora sp. BC1]AVT32864.1 mannosyltransferase [Plantactinospora sp. BC1]